MKKPYINKSFIAPVIMLWFFMSIPRAWYFFRGGLPAGTNILTGGIIPFSLGFVRDGLLVAALLIPIQLLYHFKVLHIIPKKVLEILIIAATFLFSILIAIMMADVEFFRYFGCHMNSTHFNFIESWKYMSSSFFSFASPTIMAFELLILPGIFFVVNYIFKFRKIENLFLTRKSIFITVFILIAGISIQFIPLKTSLLINLTENYGIAFIKHSIYGEELEERKTTSIEKILDTLPFKTNKTVNSPWFYPDPDYPLIKATAHHLCKLGKLPDAVCNEDKDNDGFVLKDDCNDLDPDIYPGAEDIPRNGIDEDCSGCDADPPNIIYIHWEGTRAVNVSGVGYSVPSTPNFTNYATNNGLLFANAYANGVQTRWSLISIYCSILPRLSNEWIFKHNEELNLISIPTILRKRGYETMYIHGGHIGFSNKLERFNKWFETHYDRSKPPIEGMEMFNWGLRDRDLFDFAYEEINKRDDSRPFYMTIATLSMHHPFKLPEKEFEISDHDDVRNQLSNIARYSDDALGNFIKNVLENEKLENTIIVISSDHGINWFYPHKEREQNILWEDLVWVPLALIGKNWNVEPGRIDEVRQLADIGPTILDRLGIEVPNPFIGHSLLRRAGKREPKAFFATANGGPTAGLRYKNHKFFTRFYTSKHALYDVDNDREENSNLSENSRFKDQIKYYNDLLENVYSQSNDLIEENRIWNNDYLIED